MQTSKDQAELIPQPRGSLPKVCAAVLAALIIGVIKLMTTDGFFGLVALAVLIVTLGPLLHGVCLLAEELRYHSNTRYRGRAVVSHILPACGLWGKTLLVAGLAGILLYMSSHLLLHKGQRWELVFLVPAIYTLFKSLGALGPSEVEVSYICEERKMNVAHGLAWSFYLGYLQLVLPRLENSIAVFCASHQASEPCWGRGSRKLLILIPLNANISHKLEDEDSNIRFYDNLPNNEIDRAGVRGRVYKHSIYRVQDEHGRHHLPANRQNQTESAAFKELSVQETVFFLAHDCAVEYATPLLTLYRMSQERSAGFGEPERRQQVLLFYRTLQDILDQSLECRNRYRLILLSDEHEDDPHFLSKTILRHLEQQKKEEFCLNPHPQRETKQASLGSLSTPAVKNAEWYSPESMSREPTLMISLEKPQPLKEPVEDMDLNYRAA